MSAYFKFELKKYLRWALLFAIMLSLFIFKLHGIGVMMAGIILSLVIIMSSKKVNYSSLKIKLCVVFGLSGLTIWQTSSSFSLAVIQLGVSFAMLIFVAYLYEYAENFEAGLKNQDHF